MKRTAGFIVVGVLLIAAACSPEQIEGDQPDFFVPEVSIYEIMTGIITPATNFIWERSYADTLSEEDWQRFLQSAIQISLSATAISLAPPEEVENGSFASGDMGDWQEWSEQLAALALMAKDAAETKDQTAFAAAGDAMVEVCEACHTAFLTGAQ